jgi:8-amino-3,8-dideoxy-alpha-D-manno-octulosonate transaminase
VAGELDSRVVADSGWHVYRNMEHLLQKRVPTAEGWPDTHPRYEGPEVTYRAGMLPQTDDLLARAMNIGIGVRDAGLGSAFGVTVRDGADVVDARVAQFRGVAAKYLE